MQKNNPWIGVGTSGEWISVSEALYDSGLAFNVNQEDCYTREGHIIPGLAVNRKSYDGTILGYTSNRYGVIQNYEAFSMLNPFIKAGGRIIQAGQTANGMMFMVLKLNMLTILGDDYELYVFVTNSFNRAYPCSLIMTPMRIICQNMYRNIVKDTIFTVRHNGLANNRIVSASDAIDVSLTYANSFEDRVQSLYDSNTDEAYTTKFVEKLFPYKDQSIMTERMKLDIDTQRELFISQCYNAEDNLKYHGTKLGLINAYYDWVTHASPQRMTMNFDSRRLAGLISGEAIDKKLLNL